MPQVKDYTAKQELHLDCGHTVKTGEAFHVTSVFTCDREGTWPLRILMACFAVASRKRSAAKPAQSGKAAEETPAPKAPARAS